MNPPAESRGGTGDPEMGRPVQEPLRRTSNAAQANALFRKNLTYQVIFPRWFTCVCNNTLKENCCRDLDSTLELNHGTAGSGF